jgi:hypothetical protein
MPTNQPTTTNHDHATTPDGRAVGRDRRAVVLPRGHRAELHNVPTRGAEGDRDHATTLTYDATDADGAWSGMGAGFALAIGRDADGARAAHGARGTMPDGVSMLAIGAGYRVTVWHGPAGFLVTTWDARGDIVTTWETRDALLVLRVN